MISKIIVRGQIILGFVLATLATSMPSTLVAAPNQSADIATIESLMHCYAAGTDAIGDTHSHTDPTAAGLEFYEDCFSDDAEFNVWFPHQPFNSQQFPDSDVAPPSAPSPVVGPKNWADFVNSVFRGNGYDYTQHAISNLQVEVNGRSAKLTAYLIATHMISGPAPGAAAHCVDVANGTYSLVIEKIRGEWRIKRLDITIINFSPAFSSGPGCKPASE